MFHIRKSFHQKGSEMESVEQVSVYSNCEYVVYVEESLNTIYVFMILFS